VKAPPRLIAISDSARGAHAEWLENLEAVLAAARPGSVLVLLRDPESLASTENHPAWTHMYLMMMAAQVGFAAGYVI